MASTTLTSRAQRTYRRLLEDVYRKWSPDKMEKVPDLLEKYSGQEDEVYDKAVRMYVFSQAKEQWLPLIEGMYRRFNPDKLTDDPKFLKQVLKKYEGSEANLFKALCKKYINGLTEKDPHLELHDWGVGGRGRGAGRREPGGSEASVGSCSSVSDCSPRDPPRLQIRSRKEVEAEAQRKQLPAAAKARPKGGQRAASAEPKPRPKRKRTDQAAPPCAQGPEQRSADAAAVEQTAPPAKAQRARRQLPKASGATPPENVAEPSTDRQVRTPPRRRVRHGVQPPQEATRAEEEARAQLALAQVVSTAADQKREQQALQAFLGAAPGSGSEGNGARYVDAVVEVRGQVVQRMRLPITMSLGAVAKMYEQWKAAS